MDQPKQDKSFSEASQKNAHWADQTATRIEKTLPDQDLYTLASGITPSGEVHIGNFREVITVDLVQRALRDRGRRVRFIYSWDDFDTFRKVPQNLPDPTAWQEHLRKPITVVPDPFGQASSYAAHFEKKFEAELAQVGVEVEYIYQSKAYQEGRYAKLIQTAVERKDKIADILNQYRKDPLAADWLPISVYCDGCFKDSVENLKVKGSEVQAYCPACEKELSYPIEKGGLLKLNWRTDWPMRWSFEGVDFEPGGKDHSSKGGSFDTGKQIVDQVFKGKAPLYLQYDFVSIKGMGAKMSSSTGNLITLGEALKVYAPEILRYIFVSQRPNHDFSIAFDQDVFRTYDTFDKIERMALDPNGNWNDKKWVGARRAYELSLVAEGGSWQDVLQARLKNPPTRVGFRLLCDRLQVCDDDIDRTFARFFADTIRSEEDKKAFWARAEKALFWLQHHAPDIFRYQLNQEPVACEFSEQQAQALVALKRMVESLDFETATANELNERIYAEIIHGLPIEPGAFFPVVYQKLVSKEKGPKLPLFILELGKEKVLHLL